ncbi:hypothetical protein DBO90_17450 [Mycobacterium avium]|nr:hypothetical protein DBO90_17450 [Mycobacterium avium]
MLLGKVLLLDALLLTETMMGETPRSGSGAAPSATRKRGHSAATATTTTRGAAQVDCAALGEHGLEAG